MGENLDKREDGRTVVLGLEGTAWNLSSALVDEEDVIAEENATYVPAKGGIHPREAAQHHAEHTWLRYVKAVLGRRPT